MNWPPKIGFMESRQLSAYRVVNAYWRPPLVTILWARTREQARDEAYYAVRRAGFDGMRFRCLTVRRAQEYDAYPGRGLGMMLNEENMEMTRPQ
jgi:hypothetical protein